MKKYFVVLLLFSISVQAQEIDFYMHTHKGFYLSGERIYFNVFSFNKAEKSLSLENELLTCYLVSPDREVISKVKITLFNGTASGYFSTNEELEDDYYYAVVYTRNHHYIKEIPLFKSEIKNRTELDISELGFNEKPAKDGMVITTNKASYNPREAISLKIESTGIDDIPVFSQFSMSIGKYLDQYNTDFKMIPLPGGLNFSNDLKGTVRLLEYKSMDSLKYQAKAHLNDGNMERAKQLLNRINEIGDGVLPNHLVVAYALKNGKMLAGYSNSEGRINLALDELNGEDFIYILAYNTKGERSGEAYVEKEKESDPDEFFKGFEISTSKPKRSAEIESYINNYLKVKKINNSYYLAENTGSQNAINKSYKGDFTVNLSQYSSMASIKDAMREITPRAVIKNNRKLDKDEIYLIEWGGGRFKDTPLFFIDGIPTLNIDTVMNLNYKDCQTFDVFTSGDKLKQFWQMGQNGVLSITLKPGKYNPLEDRLSEFTKISSIQQSRTVEPIRWNGSDHNSNNKPNISNTLFWNPNLFTKDGTLELQISAPDNIGTFGIELFGINEEGVVEHVRKNIKVLPNN